MDGIIVKIGQEVVNIWIFPPICLKRNVAEKNLATSQKVNANCTDFSQWNGSVWAEKQKSKFSLLVGSFQQCRQDFKSEMPLSVYIFLLMKPCRYKKQAKFGAPAHRGGNTL